MRVLVTGASGQLGYELQRTCPKNIALLSTNSAQLDITQAETIQSVLHAFKPTHIINGAAYTAVDKAESEPELAKQINAQALTHLAQAAQQCQARLIQISTDFIFAGNASQPYPVDATAQPLSVYGLTKWQGEQAVRKYCENHLIIRTAWLYSAHGRNFVKTMLGLMQSKASLQIIADQIGSPTWAKTLANCLWQLAPNTYTGTLHCTDNGVASWYDFACAIQTHALNIGLLDKAIPIYPITTQQYPTPAKRPAYSVLDKTRTEAQLGYSLPHWQHSLQQMLSELRQG